MNITLCLQNLGTVRILDNRHLWNAYPCFENAKKVTFHLENYQDSKVLYLGEKNIKTYSSLLRIIFHQKPKACNVHASI